MFDVGFTELIVIGVVAILVIGPDKLPQVARFLGSMVGRMQRYVASVKSEMEREVRLEQLKDLQNTIANSATNTEKLINAQPQKKSSTKKSTTKKSVKSKSTV
ncbi:MAG: Sec-independent protein translocase protein TatB [Methylophilaceae bacterium]|jgi:sec-independent protein translocase protein TatB|nr:twin-arginine translocase subunit TatB [Methylophilaceae bacterium]